MNDNKQPHDKYKMFKNFMFNELGLTKEDIRVWIKEAIKEQALELLCGTHGDFNAKTIAETILYSNDFFGSKTLKDEIKNIIANTIRNNIDVKIHFNR